MQTDNVREFYFYRFARDWRIDDAKFCLSNAVLALKNVWCNENQAKKNHNKIYY